MNKTKLPGLIPILILTLITVVMWVFLDVFRLLKKAPELVVPAEISQPLIPSLDQDSINQIESRIFLDDSQIPDTLVGPSSVPNATVTPEVTATPEATVTPETTATPSATTQP